jgi:hypothetical protein
VHPNRADGVVLLTVLLLTLLVSVFAASLLLVSSSHAAIAANYSAAQEARFAASAAAERAVMEVAAIEDWNHLLDGSVRSSVVDGSPVGTRRLADGSTLDLEQTVNLANCQIVVACSEEQMNAVTADRPWGANNPRWRLYAYGWLRDFFPPVAVDSPYYLVVRVADDPAEADGNPSRDSDPLNPGAAIVELEATAYGPRGARRTVALTIVKTTPGSVRILSWRAFG